MKVSGNKLGWLKTSTENEIREAFGNDGAAVIAATNVYLNGIAATDPTKATALAGFINEDPIPWCTLIYEYVPLLWIESTGNQIIETGTFASNSNKIIVDFELDDNYSTSLALFSSGVEGWSKTGLSMMSSYFYYGGYVGYSYNWLPNTLYKVNAYWDGSLAHLLVNGVEMVSKNRNNSITGDLRVTFFAAYASYPDISRLMSGIKMGHAQIYSAYNGPIIRDFYPCYRKSDGKAGLFDIVTNSFKPNLLLGEDFIKGPEGIKLLQTPANA